MSIAKKDPLLTVEVVAIVLIIIVVAIATISSINTSRMGKSPTLTHPTITGLWADTNKVRQQHHVPALALDPKLNQSAAAKCADMKAKHYYDHRSPTKVFFSYFVKKYYGNSYHYAAENLNATHKSLSSQTTIDSWLNSAPHRKALLDERYSRVGFAVCSAAGFQNVVVQHFVN